MICPNFITNSYMAFENVQVCHRDLYIKWYVAIGFFYINIDVLLGSHSVYGIYALLPLSHWVWGQLNCQTCITGHLYMMSHISDPVLIFISLLIDAYIIYVHNCHLYLLLGHFSMSSAYFVFLFQ